MTPDAADAERAYRDRLDKVNRALEVALPDRRRPPERLHEAVWHSVFGGGGGKRLRPAILLTVARDLAVDEGLAMPAAVALELVHDYSLVHDDLPCMDNALERRGTPSVHARYGYADAVLAGDALLTLAFEVLGAAAAAAPDLGGAWGEVASALARAAGSRGMAGGQHADLDRSGRAAAGLPGDEHPVLRIHRLKTARLYGFAFSAPALLSSLPRTTHGALEQAGESFGLAFQVADDLRDSVDDVEAPNYARVAGEKAALQVAREAAARCLAGLGSVLGRCGEGETLGLVAVALGEMGLGVDS